MIGDFADQLGVVLPSSYYTLTSTDSTVARVVRNETVVGAQQGFAALVATRGPVTARPPWSSGLPSRFDEPQLFTGLDVYPLAVALVPTTGTKQITVRVDGEVIPAGGILYFAGNSGVVSVGADGVINGLGEGQADVAVVYRGAEFVIKVRVKAPEQQQAVLGADGGALQATDGAIAAIAPNSLDGTQTVSFVPVAQSALPMVMPTGLGYLGAYALSFDGARLSSPAQIAIPVPESVPVGKQLFLLRYGNIPDENGVLHEVWWQDEVAIVGADHVARTSSPPWRGVQAAGVYALGDPNTSSITMANGTITVNFPLGLFPSAATLAGTMATFAPTIAVSIDIHELKVLAIPRDGLPVVTTIGVNLQPGVVAQFSASITQPAAATPLTPRIYTADFRFVDVRRRTGMCRRRSSSSPAPASREPRRRR